MTGGIKMRENDTYGFGKEKYSFFIKKLVLYYRLGVCKSGRVYF